MPKISPTRNPGEKWCCGCKQFCLITNFHRSARRKDGLTSWCKECLISYERAYKDKRATARQQRLLDRDYEDIWLSKIRRNNLQTTVDLLRFLFKANPYCVYCLVPLHPTAIHIDHKLPRSRGGTDELVNLCISCADCNRLKHTRTEYEFREFVKQYCQRFATEAE